MTALETFGLSTTATAMEVKARWRQLCMQHHPDRGGNTEQFNMLQRTYHDALAEAMAPRPCANCQGRGVIQQARGWSSIEVPCQACAGTGQFTVSVVDGSE